MSRAIMSRTLTPCHAPLSFTGGSVIALNDWVSKRLQPLRLHSAHASDTQLKRERDAGIVLQRDDVLVVDAGGC